VKTLIDAGAGVNAKDEDGATALLWAAVEGHTETAKVLIDAGADVNTKDKEYGATALMGEAHRDGKGLD
jgi:ankyrin repeat protein